MHLDHFPHDSDTEQPATPEGQQVETWHEDRPRKFHESKKNIIPDFYPPSAPRYRSWVLIALSTMALIVLTFLFQPPDAVIQEVASSDRVEIQARQAASLMPVETEHAVLSHMRKLATSPNATRRVATTWAALDRGDGNRVVVALSLMTRIPQQVEEGDELGAEADFDSLLMQAFMYPLELTDEEKKRVNDHVGWPAELLFVRDLEDTNTRKTSLYKEADKISAWATLIVLVALGAGAIGLLILARFWRDVRKGNVLFRLSPAHSEADIYLEAIAVYLACFAIGRALGVVASGSLGWLSMIMQLGGSVLAIFWPAIRGVPLRVAFKDMGLHRGGGFGLEIRAGLIGYCAVLPFFAVGVLLMMVLQAVTHAAGWNIPTPIHPDLVGVGKMGIAQRLFLLSMVSVFAPLTEELVFRGAMFRGLRSRHSFWFSAWVVALVFAAVHPQGLLAIPPLCALALGFSGLREWRDSLIAPMIAHAMHNTTLIVLLVVLLK